MPSFLGTLASVSPYVLPMAQSYLSGRRVQKDEKRLGRAQARANLINTLAPGAGAQPVFKPSDTGVLERGISAANVGLGAYQGWQKFKADQTAAQQQQIAVQQQIAEAEEARQIREGRQRASEELLQRDQGEAGLRERIAEQGQQLTDRPPLQLQTEADAMRVLEESPESFSPRLSTLQSIGGAQATSAGKELEELWSGPKGSGLGFGSPSLQAAPAPTGPAAVGYYQAMAADEERRFKASLDVEAQDIRQRQLEYNKKSLDDRTAYQRSQLEAEKAALDATREYRLGQTVDAHRTTTEDTVRKFSSVKRLGQFRSNYQAMLDLIANIKIRKAEAAANSTTYDIRGTDQIALLNFYQNMIDPATVKEGDVHLYRTQAQGLFSRIEQQLGVIFSDESGVVSDGLLEDMEESLNFLQSGYETAASQQIGQFFKSRANMGYQLIPEEVTAGLRDASFTAYGLQNPDEMRKLLEQRILEAQQRYSGNDFAGPRQALGESSDDGLSMNMPPDTLGARNNNPGNLKASDTGEEGEGGFWRFDTPEQGYEALVRQIKLQTDRGQTLSEFIHIYAPPADDNDTEDYLAGLIQATGATADTLLKDIDRNKLAEAIVLRETGTTFSAPTEDTTYPSHDWAQSVQARPAPDTILATIGGSRPQLSTDTRRGGARARFGNYNPQTDFARMSDAERGKVLRETAVDYAGRGGRFAYGNVLQPLGLLAADTLSRIYGYKQP